MKMNLTALQCIDNSAKNKEKIKYFDFIKVMQLMKDDGYILCQHSNIKERSLA